MSKKKWISIITVLALGLTVAISSQSTFADKDAMKAAKEEKLGKLKEEADIERAKLESMPNKTEEEIGKHLQQAKKIKMIDIEIDKLQIELYPEDPKEKLANGIISLRRILELNSYYTHFFDDPVKGERYRKAYETLQKKLKMMDQIEKDFQENNKTVEQLLKELDDVRKIPELVSNPN